MVSPEPIPEMPSSVSTRTRVASKCRRGWGLYSYAARTTESRLVHLAVPSLRRLVAGLGETAHLCVLREGRVLTLWTEAPAHGFRAEGWEGVPVEVSRTSAGRVLVSDW